MQKTIERPISKDIELPFQFKRSLTPINEYVSRHKLTRGAFNEYRKMGIIQIRKFKGKAFVIDTPMSQNPPIPEIKAPAEPKVLDKTIDNIKNKISSVRKIELGEVVRNNITRVESKWKIAAMVSIIFFVVGMLFSLGVYTSQKYDIDSLTQANASMMTALDNAVLQNQKTIGSRVELASSKVKIQQLQNQVSDYQSQLDGLQKQLDFANQRLEYFQQRNFNAARQFDEQKTNLINRLNKLSTNP